MFKLKYFCPKCNETLWFWDVRKKSDSRVAFYKCLNCGNSDPYNSKDMAVLPLKEAMEKMLKSENFNKQKNQERD